MTDQGSEGYYHLFKRDKEESFLYYNITEDESVHIDKESELSIMRKADQIILVSVYEKSLLLEIDPIIAYGISTPVQRNFPAATFISWANRDNNNEKSR